jgi:predicted nucleic acid-binding protein
MAGKGLILDANILFRAVLGHRVRQILEKYEDVAVFYSPDVCFQDARQYLPRILESRGIDISAGLGVLDQIGLIVQLVDRSLYEDYEQSARERMLPRDPDDWPVAALALLFNFPIWTEDHDFFGSGIATWTTDRVELYLQQFLE